MTAEQSAYLRTLVYAALLGVPAAFAAVLFQTALHDVIHLVWEVVPEELGWDEPAAWYVVLVPAIAGVLVALAVRLPGHGGHSPLEGLGMGPIDLRHLPGILLAALATLGLGLVLGPEAPMIAIGLALGALAARMVRVGETETQLLVLAGAFAAIAALFGGPLAAAFMLFELAALGGLIPAQALGRALLPGLVAAGTGALVFTGVGDWPGIHTPSLALPPLPAYDSVRLADIAWCLPLAAVVAVVVLAVHRLGHVVALAARVRPDVTLVGGRPAGRPARGRVPRDGRPAGGLRPLLGAGAAAARRRRDLGGRARSARRREGPRLRALARRRLPRRAGVPRARPRRRGGRGGRRDPAGARDRAGGRDRPRRRDRGRPARAVHRGAPPDVAARNFSGRRRADHDPRGDRRVDRCARDPDSRARARRGRHAGDLRSRAASAPAA